MVALKANADFKVFLLGLLRGCQYLANPLAIDCNWFLHENMLALLDCLGEVNRPKSRRRCENGHIRHLDSILVGIETDEFVLFFDLGLDAMFSLQTFLATIHAILKGIGHGHEFNVT